MQTGWGHNGPAFRPKTPTICGNDVDRGFRPQKYRVRVPAYGSPSINPPEATTLENYLVLGLDIICLGQAHY